MTSTFARYDELEQEVQRLSGVDRDQANASQNVAQTRATISQMAAQIAAEEKSIQRYSKRIHRNENPRFLHYFVINRAAKVERLKQEQAQVISTKENRVQSKSQKEQELGQQEQTLAQINNVVQVRNSLEAERKGIFDQVVAQNPSPRQRQIEANIAAQNNAIASEESLVQRVDAVIASLQNSERLYGQAMVTLQRAQNLNTEARIINRENMTQEEWENERRRRERLEREVQLQRDNLINEAQIPASEAYALTAQTWQTFPQEARARYPSLSAQIGHSPLPQLESASQASTLITDALFGDVGQSINNASRQGKINRNMQVIQRCIAILQSQIQLVVSLREGIRANISAMQNNLVTLTTQLEDERRNIFAAVRASVMHSSAAATAIPMPSATATPVY